MWIDLNLLYSIWETSCQYFGCFFMFWWSLYHFKSPYITNQITWWLRPSVVTGLRAEEPGVDEGGGAGGGGAHDDGARRRAIRRHRKPDRFDPRLGQTEETYPGFPLGLENLENLEKWEGIFQSGKSQGILNRLEKSGKSQGKSHKILENSGNFRQILFFIF